MYKLFVFCLLLHYVLGRAVDTCDFAAVFGSQELRNVPGFLTLYSISLPTEFFCTKRGYSHFCEKYTIKVLSSKKD
jgi:hypothetical protein